jgi:hypothetical protein
MRRAPLALSFLFLAVTAISAQPDGGATAPPSQSAGQGQPPTVISAAANEADIRLRLTVDARPEPGDLEAGLLISEQNPALRIRPAVTLVSMPAGADKTWDVVLKVSGLIPLGDSTAPLLYKGRQVVETLRFHKAGLSVKPPADGPIVAREKDGRILLVLENGSNFDYKTVKARLRFQDSDVCGLTADAFVETVTDDAAKAADACASHASWTSFTVPRSSQVSLRALTRPDWFRDPGSAFARTATRKGVLTLLYDDAGGKTAFEQNLPLEVRFEPTNWSLLVSLLAVGALLFAGAILSLLLRVSIPNYRRKKALKERLNDSRRVISDVSSQLDSQLRVLLRVELLALDQRRRDGWVLGPDFVETATRIETSLVTLERKIALARRLDVASRRLDTLLAGPVSPTRVDLIERNLLAACDVLKNDQLTEPDWVFVQQRIETGDKVLDDPTPEEKQAFEALLSQRWKAVREHFGLATNSNALIVPAVLKPIAECFPDSSLLPKLADADGTTWIASVGVIRADLQLTALEILREVQFLAPAVNQGKKWTDAMSQLTQWLATPAINNLRLARLQLLQLAEGVTEEDVVKALAEQQAHIEIDPQIVSSNQTVRMAVQFRDPKLNSATAREAIVCEWQLPEPRLASLLQWMARPPKDTGASASKETGAAEPKDKPKGGTPAAMAPPLTDVGWRIHRYFPADVVEQLVEVRFYANGKPVMTADGSAPVVVTRTVVPATPALKKDRWERWIWRHVPQWLQLLAALLVPLAALAVTTSSDAMSGQFWDLISLGFGSETIRSILTGPQPPNSR